MNQSPNSKIAESKSRQIEKSPNWKVAKLKSRQIEKSLNWKVAKSSSNQKTGEGDSYDQKKNFLRFWKDGIKTEVDRWTRKYWKKSQ